MGSGIAGLEGGEEGRGSVVGYEEQGVEGTVTEDGGCGSADEGGG